MAGVLFVLRVTFFKKKYFDQLVCYADICCFNLINVMQILVRHYSSLEVASEYFRSGADKISIGSDAVYAAEEYLRTGVCAISIICF